MPRLSLLAVLFGSCALAFADPPELIRVIRNVDWGSGPVYDATKAVVPVLGMLSTSGPSEPWFLEMHDSFASIEDLEKRMAGPGSGATYSDDVLPASKILIALYRSHLSHRWDEATKNMPRARYFLVSIYRVRPGAESGFVDLIKVRRSRYESINFDQPEIAYQIMSGAPSGTFVFLTPLASLKTLDEGLAKTPDGARAPSSAEQKLAAEVEIGHEYFLFRIDPRNSYVSDDFASGDPDFWRSRP